MKPSSQKEFKRELDQFSQYIRSLIHKARMSQVAFARYLGVRQSTVTRWLNGTNLPSLRLRKKMKELDDVLRGTLSPEDEERLLRPRIHEKVDLRTGQDGHLSESERTFERKDEEPVNG